MPRSGTAALGGSGVGEGDGEAVLEPIQSVRVSSTGINILRLFTRAFLGGHVGDAGQTPLDFAFLRLLCWFGSLPCRSYRRLVKSLLIFMYDNIVTANPPPTRWAV